ncbi:agmatine deiminase family protein [Paenibacillus senegalensis]|uniref:agmatine deiminase family protein n=1 Tax=Paenibacillus senegalensis TaxID=1465766 RepID=UPI000288DFFF|nr:agmatine deiminase family protein [Paenibacillus senegalensis]
MKPKSLHYRMPAEWTEHERTLISWPIQDSMCYPEDYHTVCEGYAQLIKAIAEFEPVTVLVNEEDDQQVKERFGGTNHEVEVLKIAHNDAWLRDNGPTYLLNEQGERAGINWKFNAWGGKYTPWDLDDEVAVKVLETRREQRFDAPLVMEGGSIHVDGEGTLLTTEECLLNPNRNPAMSREQIEDVLRSYLDIEQIIWLPRGLSGDETDGHVDNVACFAAPGKVLLQVCHDPEDENYGITQEHLSVLKAAKDAKGRTLDIIEIEQPPKVEMNGKRLTLSYLNFYFVNGGIILPVFGGSAAETDKKAEQILSETFPDRRIRTIDGMAIIKEGGNVHCTTQQVPAVRSTSKG